MVGRVPWQCHHFERPVAVAVPQQRGDRSASSGERSRRETLDHLGHRLGMIGVIVRQQDCAQATALVDLFRDRVEVFRQMRTGIDEERRLASDHPAVAAVKAERPGVIRANADHIVVR
jgi:hypothetical protein